MGIWLIALALVFNGVATYAWNDAPGMAAAVTQDHHHGAEAADRHVHPHDAVVDAVDFSQTQLPVHNHLKCCGTCNVVSLAADVSVVPVTFSYRAASFWTVKHFLVGYLAALDPDIPKSIV